MLRSAGFRRQPFLRLLDDRSECLRIPDGKVGERRPKPLEALPGAGELMWAASLPPVRIGLEAAVHERALGVKIALP